MWLCLNSSYVLVKMDGKIRDIRMLLFNKQRDKTFECLKMTTGFIQLNHFQFYSLTIKKYSQNVSLIKAMQTSEQIE